MSLHIPCTVCYVSDFQGHRRDYLFMNPNLIKCYGSSIIDMKVEHYMPSKSKVTVPHAGLTFWRATFSCVPLSRRAVTCWSVSLISGANAKYIILGVHNNPEHSSGSLAADESAVVWYGYSGRKYTHADGGIREPGLGSFCIGDVFHLKHDPQALKLHLRVDRLPNRHFTTSLTADANYYICLAMAVPGVAEVKPEASW